MYALRTPTELNPQAAIARVSAPRVRDAELGGLFCAHQRVIADASEALALFHPQGSIPNFSLHRNRFATDIELALPQRDEAYLLQLTLSGVARAALGGEVVRAGAGDFTVLNPGPRGHWRWERGTEIMIVRIRRTEFERVVAAEFGEPPKRPTSFDFQPTSIHAAPTLVGFLQLLCDDHDSARALSHPSGSKLSTEMLISLMLRLLPNDGRRRLDGSVSPAAPYYVRRAVRHMEKNFADPISLCDGGLFENPRQGVSAVHRRESDGAPALRQTETRAIKIIRANGRRGDGDEHRQSLRFSTPGPFCGVL